MPNNLFTLDYFLQGPYQHVRLTGLGRYFGKYYWARRFYAQLIKRITPKNGSILEIGCGFGDLLAFLEDDFHCYGTDISADAISEAKKKLTKSKLLVLKAEEVKCFDTDAFDTVVACHILEHLKNPANVLKQIAAILKPGGFLFMVVPNPDSLGRIFKGKNWIGFRDPTHISLYPPQKWLQLLGTNGLTIQNLFGDGLWDSPYLQFVPTVLQQIFFGFPALFQTILTVPFIPVKLGESAVIVAQLSI